MSFSVDIRKRLGHKTLKLAFDAPGGLTAVFGPSGAGKSSLIAMISGLMRPDEGRIVIAGETVFDASKINRDPSERGCGLVFQDGRLFPHLSVRGNLDYGLKLARRPALMGFDETVAFLGIQSLLERKPATLSGGEAQRVSIGRVLLAAPRCLLLDEPLSSLDAGRKGAVLEVIEDLRDRLNLPMLYVSHDLSEVKRLADHLVLITPEGTIEASGALSDLLNRPDLSVARAEEAGSVLKVIWAGYDTAYDLTRFQVGGQDIWLPGQMGGEGRTGRLSLRASDVTLDLNRPEATSALNALSGRITALASLRPHQVSVEIALEGTDQSLIAHITRKSSEMLGLKPGQAVYARIKAQGLRSENAPSVATMSGATQ